jgi:hypothetical protein
MQQTALEKLSKFTASWEIRTVILVYVHNCSPLAPNLSQINPVHTVPSYVFKIHFNPLKPSGNYIRPKIPG